MADNNGSLNLFTLPELTERQAKIIKIYERVERRQQGIYEKVASISDLTVKFCTHGFFAIVTGNIPAEIKEEARDWIKQANGICTTLGLDPSSMFADEIMVAVMDYERQLYARCRSPYNKACSKLTKAAFKADISGLKAERCLIGDQFVNYFDYDSSYSLMFTDNDKQRLFDAKQPILDSLIKAIEALLNCEWTKGYERDAEPSNLTEFLEYARLSTWIGIEETGVTYYSKKKLGSREFVTCHSTPQAGDDTRSFNLQINLYANFEQDEDFGYPISSLTFDLFSETSVEEAW